MKKYILALGVCCLAGAMPMFAQESNSELTEAQRELQGYMDEGLVKFKSDNDKFSFRVGARVAIDGAHYFDDYTDRGSGAKFSAARIRIISKIGSKVDMKLDFDFASKNWLKDAYLRWHTNKNGFLRVGNFAEPFSAENIQSTMDYPFINKSATVEALGTGRAIGVSYRYYHKNFWAEGGVFSQKFSNPTEVPKGGDMGYAVSARLLGRAYGEDWSIHAGGSVNFGRPDANGFTNGSDDYNRTVTLSSNLESCVDNTKFLSATVNNVKNSLKFGAEVMASYKKFYAKAEWLHAAYSREQDWDYNFQASLGSMMSLYFPTMEAFKALYGADRDAKFYGYTVEAGFMILGNNYRYNSVDALMNRPKGKSLEVVARFNHTDLNDIIAGSYYYGGKFFSNQMYQEFGIGDKSVIGGKANTFTLGFNYYVTNNIVARLNYSYQRLNQEYTPAYSFDKNLHSVQARVAFEF